MSSQITDEDTLKILVATDNHLGYAEKDPIRGVLIFDICMHRLYCYLQYASFFFFSRK